MARFCVYCGGAQSTCTNAPDGVHTYAEEPADLERWPKSLFRRGPEPIPHGRPLTSEQIEKICSEKPFGEEQLKQITASKTTGRTSSRREFVLVVFEQVQHFIESLRLTDLPVKVQRQQRDVVAALADALEHPKRDVNRASSNYDVSERALKFLAQLSLDGQSKDVNIERDVLVAAMKVYISASNVHKLKCSEKHVGSGGVRVFVDHGYDDFLEDADDE